MRKDTTYKFLTEKGFEVMVLAAAVTFKDEIMNAKELVTAMWQQGEPDG